MARTTGSRTAMQIDAAGFQSFRDFLEKSCGILLADNKEYLVSSRLSPIMAEHQYSTLAELLRRLQRPDSARLKASVVEAMTTNETLWFRDSHPYQILESRLLPELAARLDGQPLRIWSAACSSGQEPYSISMSIDAFKRARPGLLRSGERVVATDISVAMLDHARRGVYNTLALERGLSKERLQRYFSPQSEGGWKINSDIQARVEFRTLNLLGSFGLIGKVDVVFCRNVLIYFSAARKQQILRRIHASLKPGGYLLLGASESLGQLTDLYEMVHCSPGIIYRAR